MAVDPEPLARSLIDAEGLISANEVCTLLRNLEVMLSNRGAASTSRGAAVHSMQLGMSNG